MFNKIFGVVVLISVLKIHFALSAEIPATIVDSIHQVSIRIASKDDEVYGSGHICSGVIISNFTVLTSASCLLNEATGEFYNESDLKVAMGSLNRMVKDELTFYTDVTAIRPHSRFNRRTFANNVAIIEVETVEFGYTIIPVQMSSEKVVKDLNCYVLGWKSGSGDLTNILMKSNVKTGDGPKNLPFGTFYSSENGLDFDTCVGEEGSAIICGGFLRGIVSKDCRDDEFTQYMDVSQMFNWIWLNHLDGSLKMIDNEMLKNLVYSSLDIIAYFWNSPKIADDFEMIKFIF